MCFPFQNKIRSEDISAKLKVTHSEYDVFISIKVVHNHQIQWHTTDIQLLKNSQKHCHSHKFQTWKDYFRVPKNVAEEVKQSLIQQAETQGWILSLDR